MQRLPPIEEWWPKLTNEQKEAILEDPRAPLDPEVVECARGAPEELDHVIISGGYDIFRLSPSERSYAVAHAPAEARDTRMANSPNASSDRH